jgi:hypothetical protein
MTGVVVSEFPINRRESFRAEITERGGKLVVSLSRWKKDPTGEARRAGPAFEFGAHRVEDMADLLLKVKDLVDAGSEPLHTQQPALLTLVGAR